MVKKFNRDVAQTLAHFQYFIKNTNQCPFCAYTSLSVVDLASHILVNCQYQEMIEEATLRHKVHKNRVKKLKRLTKGLARHPLREQLVSTSQETTNISPASDETENTLRMRLSQVSLQNVLSVSDDSENNDEIFQDTKPSLDPLFISPE